MKVDKKSCGFFKMGIGNPLKDIYFEAVYQQIILEAGLENLNHNYILVIYLLKFNTIKF